MILSVDAEKRVIEILTILPGFGNFTQVIKFSLPLQLVLKDDFNIKYFLIYVYIYYLRR